MITIWKRWASIALLTLCCMGAFAQSVSKSQGSVNEFTAIEGTSALKYNYVREKNLEARYGYDRVSISSQIGNWMRRWLWSWFVSWKCRR